MLLTRNLLASVEVEGEGEVEIEREIEALSPSPSPKNHRKVQKVRAMQAQKTKIELHELPEPGQVHPPTLPMANTAMRRPQRQGGQAQRACPPNPNALRGNTV
jgi:hypothetical protein